MILKLPNICVFMTCPNTFLVFFFFFCGTNISQMGGYDLSYFKVLSANVACPRFKCYPLIETEILLPGM